MNGEAEKGTGEASLRELIEYIAKALVDRPESVDVKEIEGEQTIFLEIRVAKEDLGAVIGREGRTANALRTLLSAATNKLKKKAVMEILE